MKALSIQQPWAWLIVNGHKALENRTWRTNYRGPVLIHAGQKYDQDALDAVAANIHPVTGEPLYLNAGCSFSRGGIVGHAIINGCVDSHRSEWFVGPHAFVLAHARPLPFHPLRGQLDALPVNATLAERTRAVDAAYPFGERSHSPYRTWLRARRYYLMRYGHCPKGRKSESPFSRLILNHDFFREPDISQAPDFTGRILVRLIPDKRVS
jgi:hypothetical protein